MVKGTLSSDIPGLESQLLAMWPWISYLTSLGLRFLICKMRIMLEPTVLSYVEC